MERGEQCHLRSFLIGRSATDHHFAQSRPVDEARLERW
jgi:hypothetical protein